MTDNKRFELVYWNFISHKGVIYDNLTKEELHLSVYELVELINEVSKSEYDLKRFREEIFDRLEEMINND